MTVKSPLAVLLCLLTATLGAQTAQRATPIHTAPEVTAPVVKLVKPGEDLPAASPTGTAPAGWSAVVLPGPHELFVRNSDIGKDLDIKPGSSLRADPKSDAAELTTFQAGDEAEITGLRGRWTQIRLNRDVIAYVQGTSAPAVQRTAPVVTTAPVTDAPYSAGSNTSPVVNPTPRPAVGRPVDRTASDRSSLAALPRLFEGKLASTRVPLRPRRPYDFALEAEDGTRFAYLDLTKLLLTEQIEKYIDRTVVVYGVARPVPDTKDIVIAVESLQLR
ncbi:SH3 domain-containing protein [Actomonas aquatica]|uniref:SH3 domain-containing protein n=1 Tax=Actomonas aquatica TaxID=2866162 RepID=A0ABZ1CB99_9BACT|nr:SH3 domain-containing protein [Opitutus sp. WL0086]WRQ88964.1 SH3 domain-containing protein [Opitutus sp. WL0086]